MVDFGDVLSATESAIDTFKSELGGSGSGSDTGSASAAPTDAPETTASTVSTAAPVADSGYGEATSDGTTAPTTITTTTTPLTDAESSSGSAYTSSPSTSTIYGDDSGDADSNWTSGSSTSTSGSGSSTSSSSAAAAALRSGSSSYSSRGTSPTATTYGSSSSSTSSSASGTSGSSSNVSQSPFESTEGIATTSGGSSGMSAASIVGILVATVGVLLVAVVFVFWRRRRQGRYSQSSKGDSLRFESTSGRNIGGNGAFKTIESGRNQQLAINMDNRSFSSLTSQVSQPDDGPWADPALIAARIPMEMIDKQEMISRGGFGLVFSGTYNGETVAIKTLLPENRKNMKEIEAFFAEIQLMAELEHPRIVRFIGAAWNSLSDVICVSEFMVGGDLRTLLMNFEGDGGDASQKRPHGFDFEKVQIALHIAHGLTYLHSLDPIVLHRDLKSRNVLLSSTMEAKLTDFGVSRHRSDGLMTCNVGTSLWMAPEVMMGGQYDEKADVFSFGVLLSELDAHVTPYANVVNPSNGQRLVETAILQMVASGALQVEFSPECSDEMRALGRACTALDPRERPSASDALYKLQLALRAIQEQEVSL